MIKHKSQEYLGWGDLSRVVAIFGVVLIHSCGEIFYQYGKTPIGDWLSANFLDSLARFSVPLFVMLSGALLLKSGAELVTFTALVRRISKVFFPLLTWSIIYLFYVSYFNGEVIDWYSLLKQPAMYHLWFVYMIIGLYIFLPVFQILFEAILTKRNLQIYLLVIWLIITSFPIYLNMPMLSLFKQNSFFGYGGYFLIGAIIASSPRDLIPTSLWILIFIISVFATFGLTWWFSEEAGSPVAKSYQYFSFNVFICAVAAFTLFTRVKIKEHYKKTLRWIGDKSFLIYFVHVLVLEQVRYSTLANTISQQTHALLTILIIAIATFVISLMLATFIRLVPGTQSVFG